MASCWAEHLAWVLPVRNAWPAWQAIGSLVSCTGVRPSMATHKGHQRGRVFFNLFLFP